MTDQGPHDKKVIYHTLSFNSTCLKFGHVFPQNRCYMIFQNFQKYYRNNNNNKNTLWFSYSFHDPSVYTMYRYTFQPI